jgi:hypothetical protein
MSSSRGFNNDKRADHMVPISGPAPIPSNVDNNSH